MATERSNKAQSEYNQAGLQIQRLHYLWITAGQHAKSGRYDQWRWILDTIWRELSTDAAMLENSSEWDFDKISQENTYFKQYNKLDRQIDLAGNYRQKYLALCNLENFLRLLQDVSGKGSKYKDPDEDLID